MRKNNGFGTTKAIFHKLDDIEVFPVTNEQLDQLEKGSSSDLFLEIGLCLVSVFASFFCSLVVLEFSNTPKAFVFFLLVCILSGLLSVIMLLLWHRSRKDKSDIITKIRSQAKED